MEYSLLVKRLKKGLNPEEEKQFQEWYSSSPEHREYFEDLKENFQDSHELKINTFSMRCLGINDLCDLY